MAPAIFIENFCVQEGGEANITEEICTVENKESHEAILPVDLKENITNGQTKPIDTGEVGEASMILVKQTSNKHTCLKSPFHKGKILFSPPAHNIEIGSLFIIGLTSDVVPPCHYCLIVFVQSHESCFLSV